MTAQVISLLSLESFGQANSFVRCAPFLSNVNTFAAVYFDDRSLNELGKFDMVILDPDNYDASDVGKLKLLGATPIAYLNIGEIEIYRKYYKPADSSLFLSPDPNWRYCYYSNICNPGWQELVLEKRIPEILDKGFCGLFLDLSDLLSEYPSVRKCAVSLIRKIRDRVGLRNLIVDGGTQIVDKIGDNVDGLAVEGLMGHYDFQSDNYVMYSSKSWDRKVTFLINKAKKYRIKIFQLDYASPADFRNRERIISESRRLGFIPYVGTIELDTVFMDTIHKIRKTAQRSAFDGQRR